MNELGLFAGGGFGLLASKWLLGHRIVCYVEKDPYRVKLLRARIRDGYLDDAPTWDDIRTFDGRPWRGVVDIISAGFPRQPFSSAGKRLAGEDERNLWPDTVRVIQEVAPEWVFLENSPRIRCPSRKNGEITVVAYFGDILGNLAEGGYDVRWDCIPASAVGAPHRRDRIWVVAHARSHRLREWSLQYQFRGPIQTQADIGDDGETEPLADPYGSGEPSGGTHRGVGRQWKPDEVMAHPQGARIGGLPTRPGRQEQAAIDSNRSGQGVGDTSIAGLSNGSSGTMGESGTFTEPQRPDWWEVEPDVGRVVDGTPSRVDRLATIGEGQVPAVAALAWRLLTGF